MTRPTVPAPSPLRGKYLVRNPVWNAWLSARDWMHERLMRNGAPAEPVNAPRRVLVAVGGHLGDAVIATSLFRHLARAFPGAEIGVLTASWNRRVFEHHPLVSRVHVRDHWKLNRDGGPLASRWRESRRSEARARREIEATGYDVALDLAAYYPNFARVLRDARIPVRVGYTSGGDGPLYTHPVAWRARDHVAQEHLALLDPLIPALDRDQPAAYDLAAIPGDAMSRAQDRARKAGLIEKEYVVAHVGAGHARKEWPIEKWAMVARDLGARGVPIALTGSGPAQRALTRQLAARVEMAVDLCDQLEWDEFRATIANARLVLSVDTVAMHLAAAHNVPCVALMTAMDDPRRWRPLGPATVLVERVPCAPCYLSKGCPEMSCVRDISVAAVLEAANARLGITSAPIAAPGTS